MTRPDSSVLCEHAREMPAVCPCSDDCYCKEHSCKPKPAPEKQPVSQTPTHLPHGYPKEGPVVKERQCVQMHLSDEAIKLVIELRQLIPQCENNTEVVCAALKIAMQAINQKLDVEDWGEDKE